MDAIKISRVIHSMVATIPETPRGFDKGTAQVRFETAGRLLYITYLELAREISSDKNLRMGCEDILEKCFDAITQSGLEDEETVNEDFFLEFLEEVDMVPIKFPLKIRVNYYLAWCAMFELVIQHTMVVPMSIIKQTGWPMDRENFYALVADLEVESEVLALDDSYLETIFKEAHGVMNKLIVAIFSNEGGMTLH
mgnify:CR=1 FL=1